MKQLIIVSFISFITLSVAANSKTTRYAYINMYKEIAVREMFRSGIPASITLAKAVLNQTMGTALAKVEQSFRY